MKIVWVKSKHWMMLCMVWLSGAVLVCAQTPPAEDIRPEKALVEIPEPQKFPLLLWSVVAGVILLGVIIGLLWRKWSRKRKAETPAQLALTALHSIESNREALAAEVFANRAAQTLREYISARFGLAAPRRTTEEFLREVESSSLLGESDHLKAFLKSCDLAKFAGSELDAAKRAELIQTARSFVHATAISPS